MHECGIGKAAELSRQAKVSKATVSLWLNDATHEIEGPNLTWLSKILKCDAHWLQTGEGEWVEPAQTPEATALRQEQPPYKIYDEFERQLLYFFNGMDIDHKEALLMTAQAFYLMKHPEDKLANPYPTLPRHSSNNSEQ